jgi:hypothetical protein
LKNRPPDCKGLKRWEEERDLEVVRERREERPGGCEGRRKERDLEVEEVGRRETCRL